MNKQTKRIKRNRKNKSRKYYGGNVVIDDKSKGIFDVIGDKISGYSGKAFDYVKDKGLRLAGLQPIKQPEVVQTASTQEIDNKINEIGDAASGLVSDAKEIGSDIVNVFDKGSAAVVENINNVLESPEVGKSLNEVAEETAEIGEKLLENFNEKLSSPKMKEEAKEALENAADYTEIVVDAMDEPINKAVDQLNEAGTKAASGAISGAIKVGSDAMAAVPGVGAIIEVGKILNDVSRAAGDVASATSDATSTISKVVEETSKNIDKGLDKLDEKKDGLSNSINSITPDVNFKPNETLNQLNKEGTSISNRVDKSINKFENPVSSAPVLSGGKKTRRKFLKRKGKSKRVRFAI